MNACINLDHPDVFSTICVMTRMNQGEPDLGDGEGGDTNMDGDG
jgi:hypothetical protein